MAFIKNISTPDHSDAEMIALYKQTGDLSVLADLYQRYMELVYGVCLKYFKDAELSKDAVMSIFEELVEKLRHHEVNNFRSWLHTLSRNHCLMQLRTPKNLKTVEFNPEFMHWEETVHLNGVLEKEAEYVKLEKCMEILPNEQKQAVHLFYLQKKCYDEIAEITGYEWNKVRSYIQNGRRNLKHCMEEQGGAN
ncbi:MAG TPA: sigma-70 family RNA polymerase sigma factor [Agriterribacter sp.]|nr:sigma-70 family RNA polymerase sigma factor [Agriterribacter sp.]